MNTGRFEHLQFVMDGSVVLPFLDIGFGEA